MFRRLFRKAPPLPDDYRALSAALAREDDPAKRAVLEQRLNDAMARLLDRSADAAQVAVWQLGERMSGQLREQFGATNEMLSDLRAQSVEQGAVLSAARAEFHGGLNAVGESLSNLRGEVGEVRAVVDRQAQRMDQLEAGQAALVGQVGQQDERHKMQIGQLNQQLIKANIRLDEANTRLDESVADRAALHAEIEAIRALLAQEKTHSAPAG